MHFVFTNVVTTTAHVLEDMSANITWSRSYFKEAN